MSAPALILLPCGFTDESTAQVAHLLRGRMQEMRPKLPIHVALFGRTGIDPVSVASKLIATGTEEIVFVPLDLTRAVSPHPDAIAQVNTLRTAHPDRNIMLARPIGPAIELLPVLDFKLRQALSAVHVMELDSLVLATSGLGDSRGAALLSRRARQWRNHHHLPVQLAYADGSGPSIATALAALRAQGRRATAVGALFLAPDASYNSQVESALAAGAVVVSPPIGSDERLLDLIMARYAVAALAMLDDVVGPALIVSDVESEETEALLSGEFLA
ncbi:MAG: CbiX/SirB N-terminal domain-containing protein [Propionibacteriaceae bacterium]|jgi:sirohydrochlorin ferrochelatase|nr:CbiX/SirB N-terminal domain-containing protein [Propionibacteriaceae bacterium]